MDRDANCLEATRSFMSSVWREGSRAINLIAISLLCIVGIAMALRGHRTLLIIFGNVERQGPTKFTSYDIMSATNNYTTMLASGGFGSVYKGTFIDGSVAAVKVLRGGVSAKRMEEQFMAEVGTIGRVHHMNLVRLIGFCVEKDTTALVYEYMSNGSLDKHLFASEKNKNLAFEKLHEIAVGTARGIAYLHEECQERIIHYDIKPQNILLDHNLHPKVSDFGLAKLCSSEKSYVTMTGLRGTPGYAAPELWMPFRVTHKCDLYSFGMLLFEIVGRRRNLAGNVPESQEWLPMRGWKKFESENLRDLITGCGIEDKDEEMAERMVKIALWCVQYKPELRPKMSDVVKMLEGSMDVADPSNPFQHLMDEADQVDSSIDGGLSTLEGTESSICNSTRMKKQRTYPDCRTRKCFSCRNRDSNIGSSRYERLVPFAKHCAKSFYPKKEKKRR
ncbi:G-type lectin S-receptor-like serine/threonine-protein kinase At5g24080 isoform X2 [Neltuma alba]|uniref:G-type lectin S-receptor-like serine/threonine-protein kinase At5g24080 isoform X2 n=1 Tax=Neltuma alba TaxID=207710 RepID=UPI0010A2DC19|nr:G-type lectin S-receptor-like serine/threonine-protein kinase At5g24080 isoform X2 [Prosopis alba]